jgi:tight adherence protein C
MFLEDCLNYPELVAAAVVALAVPALAAVSGEFSAPFWLTKPAVSLLRSLPEKYITLVNRWLVWANLRDKDNYAGFCSAKLILLLVLAFLALAFNPLCLPLAAAGYLLPDLLLLLKVKRRQAEIRDTLPQALDLMVMCVDAGLALDAAVQRCALERSGVAHALGEELTSLGRDLLLGTERERAYKLLYVRTGVEELKTLGSAMNQSAKMGLSIARVLRAQSDFLRMRARLRAEEKAVKLPVYMAFPMWFCIMPALLMVVLAPSIITFLTQAGRL